VGNPERIVLSDARGVRLNRAYTTLVRGSDFLSRSLQARAEIGQDSLAGAGGAKVVGNGLRELDRFLSLLLDEAAAAICPADFDGAGFVRSHNVANKIDAFYDLAGAGSSDTDRLRAIGRVRACLHHCRGIVHDPSLWRDLRVAAGDGPRDGLPKPADRLTVTFDELGRICGFYARSGAGLMAACHAIARIP
jgi:hypothetical protein